MKELKSRSVIIVIALVILLASSSQGNIFFPLQSIGYTAGYEGVKASFVAIQHDWGTESFKTDLMQGTSFYFDPDEPDRNAPDLVGEMTNAFVPEQVVPSWVPYEWFSKGQSYIKNPIETVTWDLPNPDNSSGIIAYEVQEWILKMYISITCEWDDKPFDWTTGQHEVFNQRYRNAKVWIELSINKPSWIFEGQPQTYFAIGKVTCSDFAYGKLGTTEDDYTPTPWISVTPESTSWLYVYYQKYGSGGQVTDIDPFQYQGRILNPELFTEKVFCQVGLNNFGTQYEAYWDLSTLEKGDAVTWGFDVHVFVVGEWKVKDVAELPDEYGRTPKVVYEASWFTALLQNPSFQLWSIIGLIALIVIVLAIFAPSVLYSIFSIANRRKR